MILKSNHQIVAPTLTAGCIFLFALLLFVLSFSRNDPNPLQENSTDFMPATGMNKLGDQNEVVTQTKLPIPRHHSRTDSIDIAPPFSSSQIDTARSLIELIRTGEMKGIRDLPREDIESLVSEYVSKIPHEQVAESLEKHIGIPRRLFYSVAKPDDYLMEIIDVARGDVDFPQIPSNIIFTDSCASDGAVLGSTHIIPEGATTVFAVFENQGLLQELEHVYAVWRDLNNDKMQFSEYEPLRVSSRYNYVWLRLDKGWSSGYYQLDLADPATPSHILATAKFKVEK